MWKRVGHRRRTIEGVDQTKLIGSGGEQLERLAYDARPQGGSMVGSFRKKLCQQPLGGTGLRAFDFDMAISDSLDRTYVLDEELRRLRRERKVSSDSLRLDSQTHSARTACLQATPGRTYRDGSRT